MQTSAIAGSPANTMASDVGKTAASSLFGFMEVLAASLAESKQLIRLETAAVKLFSDQSKPDQSPRTCTNSESSDAESAALAATLLAAAQLPPNVLQTAMFPVIPQAGPPVLPPTPTGHAVTAKDSATSVDGEGRAIAAPPMRDATGPPLASGTTQAAQAAATNIAVAFAFPADRTQAVAEPETNPPSEDSHLLNAPRSDEKNSSANLPLASDRAATLAPSPRSVDRMQHDFVAMAAATLAPPVREDLTPDFSSAAPLPTSARTKVRPDMTPTVSAPDIRIATAPEPNPSIVAVSRPVEAVSPNADKVPASESPAITVTEVRVFDSTTAEPKVSDSLPEMLVAPSTSEQPLVPSRNRAPAADNSPNPPQEARIDRPDDSKTPSPVPDGSIEDGPRRIEIAEPEFSAPALPQSANVAGVKPQPAVPPDEKVALPISGARPAPVHEPADPEVAQPRSDPPIDKSQHTAVRKPFDAAPDAPPQREQVSSTSTTQDRTEAAHAAVDRMITPALRRIIDAVLPQTSTRAHIATPESAISSATPATPNRTPEVAPRTSTSATSSPAPEQSSKRTSPEPAFGTAAEEHTALAPAPLKDAPAAIAPAREAPSAPGPFAQTGARELPQTHQMLDSIPATATPAPTAHLRPETSGDAEMRVGIRTAAFGAVEIYTSVHQNQVGLAVHGGRDLTQWFSTEAQNLESGLRDHQLNLTTLEMHSTGNGLQTATGSHHHAPQDFRAVPHSWTTESAELSTESEAIAAATVPTDGLPESHVSIRI